jgi:hypothetical protein
LAKKAGLSDDNFTNELTELLAKGYQPPKGTSIFDVHYWTEYVDLSTGLIIGWDNNTKTIGEHFNHSSYLLFDKKSNSTPAMSEKSIFNAEFNVGIREINFGHSFGSKEILFRFEPFKFTLELMRLEASQSGMHKYLCNCSDLLT